MYNQRGSPQTLSYDYFHGWTVVTGGAANGAKIVNCNGGGSSGGCGGLGVIDHTVFDGSDSSGASTPYAGAMSGVGNCTVVEYSVIRYVGNFCVDSSGRFGSGTHLFRNNLFEYLYNPVGGHGNIIEMNSGVGGASTTGPVYFYGNVIRHFQEGIALNFIPDSGGKVYIFNNVLYDNGHASDCFLPNSNGTGVGITTYFYNNTIDSQVNSQGNNPNGGCVLNGDAPDHTYLENNHFINVNTSTNCTGSCGGTFVSAFASGGTITDNGNEVWQTEATAVGQGYVGCQGTPTCSTGNDYAIISTSGSTYHAGNNNTSLVSTFSPFDSAYGGGTTKAARKSATVAAKGYPAQPLRPTPAARLGTREPTSSRSVRRYLRPALPPPAPCHKR